MSVEYYGDKTIDQVFADMLATHPDLRLLYEEDVVFRICAVRRENKNGEPEHSPGPPVKVKRIPEEDAPFIEGHFKVYVDAVRWETANYAQREAMVHSALCNIEIVETKSGRKIQVGGPDVVYYAKTLAWYGTYDEGAINLRNNLQGEHRGCVLKVHPEPVGPPRPVDPDEAEPDQGVTDPDQASSPDATGMGEEESVEASKKPTKKPKENARKRAKAA
jgi:hypothetical protein